MNQFLVLFSFLVSSFCFSQRTITGTVSDADGEPLMGATISIKGTGFFTYTDFDGKYSIEANSEDILVFSALCEPIEILVGDQTVVNVSISNTFYGNIIVGRGRENEVQLIHGYNYETLGFQFKHYGNILPKTYYFDLGYGNGFNGNSHLKFSLSKIISFEDYSSITIKTGVETADFDYSQYHSYKVSLSRKFQIRSATRHQQFSLFTGYMNYDGIFKSKDIGFGIGMKREMGNLKISSSFIHWQEFNEFNASLTYYINRITVTGNYKHLADYEEFQIGLGYDFYF